jgi:hypothetical protein
MKFVHLGAPAVAGSDPEIFDFAGTPQWLLRTEIAN